MLNQLLINPDMLNNIIRADSQNGVRIIVILIFIIFMLICVYFFKNSRKDRIKKLARKNESTTPQEFFKLRKKVSGKT